MEYQEVQMNEIASGKTVPLLSQTEEKTQPDAQEIFDKMHAQVTGLADRLQKVEREYRRPTTLSTKNFSAPDPFKTAIATFMKQGLTPQGLETKSLAAIDPTGGAVIQEYVHERIREYLEALSPIRSLANTLSVGGEGIDILIEKGKAEVGWVAETAERPETKTAEIFKLHISTHEIYAKPKVTQKLLDDARVDLEAWLLKKIAQQMSVVENQAFLLGDGVHKPKGILSYPLKEEASWGTFESLKIPPDALAQEKVITEGLLSTFHALKPHFLPNATWLMSRQALAQIRKLRDDKTGRFVWQPGLTAEATSTLMGHPVVVVDDLPPFEKDRGGVLAIFGDVRSAYQIVDRSGLTVLRDPYSAKPYVEFYATRRVGGDVVNFEALKFLTM